jgi:hypothetical protein
MNKRRRDTTGGTSGAGTANLQKLRPLYSFVCHLRKKFEDIKGVVRIPKSLMKILCNG